MTQTTDDRILLVLTNHAVLGDTGRPTGAYLSEVAHPHDVFARAGFAVDFASIRGGAVPLDGTDDPDAIGRAFLDDADLRARLAATRRLGDVDPADYSAVVFAGGHGTMWDFPGDADIGRVAAAVYERGGVVAAVCHGTAALVDVRLSDGRHLVAGKDVAAFTNDEERAAGLTEVVPFLVADVLTERGARHRPAPNWQAQVITSERLVTGQNPASATGMAEAVAELIRAQSDRVS